MLLNRKTEAITMAKLLLGLLLVLAIIGTTSANNCDKDAEAMKQECKKFEEFPANPKLEPSPACCAVWQRADIPCLCKRVTPEAEKLWCMEKVVYVANYCKKPFTPGYKCGSKLTLSIYTYNYPCLCVLLYDVHDSKHD